MTPHGAASSPLAAPARVPSGEPGSLPSLSGPGSPGRWLRRAAPLALLGLGLVLAGRGLWLPAKAALGQLLLEGAWQRSRAGVAEARPWPWADTRPVARLRFPARGEDLVVLAGASGAVLAWAPGWVTGSDAPGSAGNVAVAGHRDTHFRLLADLAVGEPVELETTAGAVHRYRVTDFRVLHFDDTGPLAPTPEPSLTLITCWPPRAVLPGGPLRLVVRAVADPAPSPAV